jgi:hypothetical protein
MKILASWPSQVSDCQKRGKKVITKIFSSFVNGTKHRDFKTKLVKGLGPTIYRIK